MTYPLIILCGGKGTRLRSVVSDRPKVLANIGNHAFLKYLLDYWITQGFTKIVLATGYMSAQVQRFIDKNDFQADIIVSEEMLPLGTGGALKQALHLKKASHQSTHAIVINGDTLNAIDCNKFVKTAIATAADFIMLVRAPNDEDRFGKYYLTNTSEIRLVDEQHSIAVINAGIYLINVENTKRAMRPLPPAFSLEDDYIPQLMKSQQSSIRGIKTSSHFIDIGTPASLEYANSYIPKHFQISGLQR